MFWTTSAKCGHGWCKRCFLHPRQNTLSAAQATREAGVQSVCFGCPDENSLVMAKYDSFSLGHTMNLQAFASQFNLRDSTQEDKGGLP